MKIELTKDQAQALLSLIDIAVKAGGLSVASTAVFFHNLLEQAAKVPELAPPKKMVQIKGIDDASEKDGANQKGLTRHQ